MHILQRIKNKKKKKLAKNYANNICKIMSFIWANILKKNRWKQKPTHIQLLLLWLLAGPPLRIDKQKRICRIFTAARWKDVGIDMYQLGRKLFSLACAALHNELCQPQWQLKVYVYAGSKMFHVYIAAFYNKFRSQREDTHFALYIFHLLIGPHSAFPQLFPHYHSSTSLSFYLYLLQAISSFCGDGEQMCSLPPTLWLQGMSA